MPAGPQGWDHLWIVITEPHPETNLAVSITTLRNNLDTTVFLRIGSHPFIRKDSVPFYQDARIADASEIDNDIRHGRCRSESPCDQSLVGEIECGLRGSDFTPNKVLRFLDVLPG